MKANALQFVQRIANQTLTVGSHQKISVTAKAGEEYNLINPETGRTVDDVTAERDGDDLRLRSPSYDAEVVIKDFWDGDCADGQSCYVALTVPNLSGGLGQAVITQEGPALEHLFAGEVGTLSDSGGVIAWINSDAVSTGMNVLGLAASLLGLFGVVGGKDSSDKSGQNQDAGQGQQSHAAAALSQPTIAKIETSGSGDHEITHVSGQAEPSSKIEVKNPAGQVIGASTTSSQGNYRVVVSTPLKNGELIEVTAHNDQQSSPPAIAVAPDTTPPNIQVFQNDGHSFSGQTEAGAQITIENDKGELVAQGNADAAGHFAIALDAGKTAGAVVKITATDDHGNFSSITENVDGNPAPAAAMLAQRYPSEMTEKNIYALQNEAVNEVDDVADSNNVPFSSGDHVALNLDALTQNAAIKPIDLQAKNLQLSDLLDDNRAILTADAEGDAGLFVPLDSLSTTAANGYDAYHISGAQTLVDQLAAHAFGGV